MNNQNKTPLGGKELVDQIVKNAQEKLAEKIVVIDLREHMGSADWFVVCQADSTVHTSAIGYGITKGLAEKGTRPWHQEGSDEGRWVLIDFSDVVVHIMLPELRKFYDLESLWPDAQKVEIKEN